MAFFWLLLYLVVVYLRPAEWVPLFRGWQLVDLTLMGTALCLLFEISLTRRRMVQVPHNRLILGLLGAILASHLVHTYALGALTSLTEFSKTVITFFLIVSTVTTKRKLQATLMLLTVLTVLLAWQGIYQHGHGRGWAGQWMATGQRITWISIFNDPNDLALAFVIIVPILLGYLVKPMFPVFKLIPLVFLGLVLHGIYLTNSRGGVLALMAAVGFFFVKRSRWVIPGSIVGGTLAALIFTFGPSRLGLLEVPDESTMGRLDSWYYGFQLLKANPVFGVGQNLFTDQYPLTAHNSFVLAAAELGLVGLFCWVAVLYASFKGLSLVEKHHARLAPYAYGLQAGLVGFTASAFFLSRTYIEIPYLVCALAAALYAVARQDTDAVAFEFGSRDVRNVALLSIASLALVQVAMKTWL